MNEFPLTMTRKAIMAALSISRSTFYRLCKAGHFISCPQIKRNKIYNAQQVLKFANQALNPKENWTIMTLKLNCTFCPLPPTGKSNHSAEFEETARFILANMESFTKQDVFSLLQSKDLNVAHVDKSFNDWTKRLVKEGRLVRNDVVSDSPTFHVR